MRAGFAIEARRHRSQLNFQSQEKLLFYVSAYADLTLDTKLAVEFFPILIDNSL